MILDQRYWSIDLSGREIEWLCNTFIFLIVQITLLSGLCGNCHLFYFLGVFILLLCYFHFVAWGGPYPQQLVSKAWSWKECWLTWYFGWWLPRKNSRRGMSFGGVIGGVTRYWSWQLQLGWSCGSHGLGSRLRGFSEEIIVKWSCVYIPTWCGINLYGHVGLMRVCAGFDVGLSSMLVQNYDGVYSLTKVEIVEVWFRWGMKRGLKDLGKQRSS